MKKVIFFRKDKKIVTSTYTKDVVSGVGGFAALYEIDEDRFLASGTDGVGTNWIWKFPVISLKESQLLVKK